MEGELEQLEKVKKQTIGTIEQDRSNYIRHVEIDNVDYENRHYSFEKTSSRLNGFIDFIIFGDQELSVSETNKLMACLDAGIEAWAEEYSFDLDREAEQRFEDGREFISEISYTFDEDITVSLESGDKYGGISGSVSVTTVFDIEEPGYQEAYMDLDRTVKGLEDHFDNVKLKNYN